MKTNGISRLLADCTACGRCLAVCPTYRQSGNEQQSPRGRIALLRGALAGRLDFGEIAPALAACVLCGKCERICPAGLALTEAFLQARTLALPRIARQRRLGARLLSLPMLADLAQTGAALVQRATRRREWKTPALALRPWQGLAAGKPGVGPVALFFPGCLVRRFMPHVAQAGASLLEKCGYQVLTLRGLGCCARPLAMQGRTITPLIRRNLALLAKVEFVWLVTMCPACLDTITRIWLRAPGLGSDEKKRLASVAGRCRDINTFLVGLAKSGAENQAGEVFWHKPCLLGSEAEQAVLARLGNTVKGASAPDSCCGAPLACIGAQQSEGAGHFARPVVQGEALAREARSQAAGRLIVTACPGCMLTLGKTGAAVKHSVEVVDESLRDLDQGRGAGNPEFHS